MNGQRLAAASFFAGMSEFLKTLSLYRDWNT